MAGNVRGVEGPASGDQLVEHDACREQVRPCIEILAAHLLGRHIRGRSTGPCRPRSSRHRAVVSGRQRHGEAKIENLHMIAVSHEDVGWLDIAVHDAPGVRSVERVGNLDPELDHPVACHRPAADHSREHLALEQLHHNEVTALVLRNLVDSADVRMVQARRSARLVLKSRDHPVVGRELDEGPASAPPGGPAPDLRPCTPRRSRHRQASRGPGNAKLSRQSCVFWQL